MLLSIIEKTIENYGFNINKSKKTIRKATQRQTVTGIIVNKKTNVSRLYIRNVRAILHSIDICGLENATYKYKEINKSKYLESLRRYYLTAENTFVSDDILH